MNTILQLERTKIRKQLIKEIQTLNDRRGILNSGIPNYHRLFASDYFIAAWQLLDWNRGL